MVLAPFCTWLAVREGMHFGTPLVPRPAEILLFDAVRHPATPYQHGDADAGEPQGQDAALTSQRRSFSESNSVRAIQISIRYES